MEACVVEEVEIAQIVTGLYTFRLLKRPDGSYRSEPLSEPHGLFPIPVQQGKPEFIAEYVSRSHPEDPPYKVFRNPDGSLFCTCLGNKRFGHCWHVDDLREKLSKEKEED
jgi:hypothetical protein